MGEVRTNPQLMAATAPCRFEASSSSHETPSALIFLTGMPSNGPKWSTIPSFFLYLAFFLLNLVKDRGYPILSYRIFCQIKGTIQRSPLTFISGASLTEVRCRQETESSLTFYGHHKIAYKSKGNYPRPGCE